MFFILSDVPLRRSVPATSEAQPHRAWCVLYCTKTNQNEFDSSPTSSSETRRGHTKKVSCLRTSACANSYRRI